ncbi:hypothetical protein [Polaromonas sp. YR568]|uniref:hypothetical protein n=1 Tax=Polaromonas sp. YR568 TaxID=1855301 RepID=UPI00398BD19C
MNGFRIKGSVALAVCMALSACAMPDPASFSLLQGEIAPLVKDGMPLADAVAALKPRGFSCMEGTSFQPGAKGIFECSRSRAPLWPPYGCIHRIWFEATPPNSAISNVRLFNPVCAGL